MKTVEIRYCKTNPDDIESSINSLEKARNTFKLFARGGYLSSREYLENSDFKYHRGLVNVPIQVFKSIATIIFLAVSYYIVYYALNGNQFDDNTKTSYIAAVIVITVIVGAYNLVAIDDSIKYTGKTIANIKGNKLESRNTEITDIVDKLDKSLEYIEFIHKVSQISNLIKNNKTRDVFISVNDKRVEIKYNKYRVDPNMSVSIDICGIVESYDFESLEETLMFTDRSFKRDLIDFSWVDGDFVEHVKYVYQLMENKDGLLLVDKESLKNNLKEDIKYAEEDIGEIVVDLT